MEGKEEILVALTRQAVPDLAEAIREVHLGHTYLSPKLVDRVIGEQVTTVREVLTLASVAASALR